MSTALKHRRFSQIHPPIDSLERRRLFATFNLANGNTIQVVGTAADETIVVTPRKGDATQIDVVVDRTVIGTVAASAVQSIEINSLDGDDDIAISKTLTARSNIRGGAGNDTIHGGAGNDFLAGEKGEDYVYGGSGNDLVTGGGQKNHLFGEDGDDKAVGGDGRDFIFGGAGKDRLYGNLGNDDIDGGGGSDRLYGSSDSDYLLGGTGNDRIYGNSEADTLGGGLGRDTLIGGENEGDDVAFADSSDVLSQIEILK